MRFHVGFSFRLKTLKKFLLPFLVGLLAYLGLGNILQVHAYENLNTDYKLYYDYYDFQSLSFGDYTFDEVWNLLTQENDNYYVIIYVNRNASVGNESIQLAYSLIPKNQTTEIYAWARGNQSTFNSQFNTSIARISSLRYIGNDFDETYYNAIDDCLINNNCSNSTYFSSLITSVDMIISIPGPNLTINNNQSYDFYLPQDVINASVTNSRFMLYSNYLPIKYVYLGTNNQSSTLRYKNLYINDTLLNTGDTIPAYCDYWDCSNFGGGGTPPYIEWFDEPKKIPRLYIGNIPKSDISTVDYNFFFNYLDLNFANSLTFNINYYGRVNHQTYYSYEKINCTQTTEKIWDNGIDTSYQFHMNNISCSSSLTNYDQIFVTMEPLYDLNTNFKINYYYSSLSGGGYDNYYFGDENFSIVERFYNLPSDFNILLSTNTNLTRATFLSDNNYIFGAKVDRNNNKISSLVANQVESFGSYDNTSLMIYNFKPQNDNVTGVINIFFNSSTILSVGDNGSYTYYDSTNTIVTGNIDNNYQNYTDNSYDLGYYFSQVNNFLQNINNDLYEVHNIFENVFNMIPSFFQLCIIVFYILLMTYLLFKFIRS